MDCITSEKFKNNDSRLICFTIHSMLKKYNSYEIILIRVQNSPLIIR